MRTHGPTTPATTACMTRLEHVLCVDDTPVVLDALERLLRDKRTVSCARDGRQALELLREQPDISIILADYTMPEMDGLTFLATARTLAPATARILMTAWPNVRAIERAIEDGLILGCLTKPFGAKEVYHALGEASDHLRMGAGP